MANSLVQSLQIAVRRRLWRGQFVAAARLALWGSAGLMLLAVAVHLAARPVRVDAVLLAIVALWIALMAWAALLPFLVSTKPRYLKCAALPHRGKYVKR